MIFRFKELNTVVVMATDSSKLPYLFVTMTKWDKQFLIFVFEMFCYCTSFYYHDNELSMFSCAHFPPPHFLTLFGIILHFYVFLDGPCNILSRAATQLDNWSYTYEEWDVGFSTRQCVARRRQIHFYAWKSHQDETGPAMYIVHVVMPCGT